MENQNENQTKFQYTGKEVNIEEATAEQVAAAKELQKNSLWRTIENGKTASLTFTGKIFKREAVYDTGKSLKYDFELSETNPEGKNKLFSVGSTSKVAKAIIANLKSGSHTMFLSRDGEGKSTTYKVSVPE